MEYVKWSSESFIKINLLRNWDPLGLVPEAARHFDSPEDSLAYRYMENILILRQMALLYRLVSNKFGGDMKWD